MKSSLCVAVLAILACTQQPADASAQTSRPQTKPAQRCTPLETRTPNVPSQRPTFAGQTRACEAKSNVAFDVVVLAKGLEHPWAVEPLPDGELLITERPGRMRIVSVDGKVSEPIRGVPPVVARGQGGLLDVVLGPTFEKDRIIYFSFSEQRPNGGNATSVARAVLSADRKGLYKTKVIFRAMPSYDGTMHFGSRLAFGPDGMLYVTLGERSDLVMRPQAQHMDSHMGKTIRIHTDGRAPMDNPFIARSEVLPEIWDIGHRNVQAAAFDAQGRLWTVDHGAQGGDELNLIRKGANYGWPLVTFGEEYSGKPIPNSVTTKAGFVDPIYYWDPVIAPSGAQFYSGDAFPAWRGNLFVGSLKDALLVRLVIENDRVTGEEHLLADRGQRIRDVRQGRDGLLYIVTDEDNGELWKVVPRR